MLSLALSSILDNLNSCVPFCGVTEINISVNFRLEPSATAATQRKIKM